MSIAVKRPGQWMMATLLSLVSLVAANAANDLRLVEAAKQGDKKTVSLLLKQQADANSRQADGATALAWASYRDDLETADLLIGAGADVNVANDYGVTPLLLACTNGSAAMVEKLLKAAANPSATTLEAGETPLMRCARTGNVEALKSLLAHKVEVNAKDTREGHTALMWAAAKTHPEVVRALLEHGADVKATTKGGFTPLMFASQQGDIESARLLLAAGANVNVATPDGDTPLLVASISGHEAFSIFLLDNGANPNAAERNGFTALHYSLLNALARIADLTPAMRHLQRPDMVELVKALLAHGANPNARIVSPRVNIDTGPGYGKIISRPAPPEPWTITPVGATPFLLAAMAGVSDTEIMRILAAGGADPLLPNKEDVTPLMVAAGLNRPRNAGPFSGEEERKALEAVKLCVELGADVNATSNLGLTALHGAAFSGGNSIVQFLVEKGANLDAKDQSGQTPLHKALTIQPSGVVPPILVPRGGQKSTADLLLKLGATPVSDPVAQAAAPVAATAGK